MNQKHLFIIDPLAGLNLQLDSSLRMACELSKAGASVYVCQQEQLAWDSQQRSAYANCQPLTFLGNAAQQPRLGSPLQMLLSECQGLHMRKEPPLDVAFLTTTWLLESAAATSHIFNSPAALRSLNEKLAIFQFPEAITPALVSADPGALLKFARERCQGDVIVKPLDLFGGRGVFRLQLSESSEAVALARLAEATREGLEQRLIQAFNQAIYEGEVRAFAVGGEPLAWCLKKPQSGQFLANTAAGARLLPFQPSPALTARVRSLAGRLYKAGVALVGFDMIGEALSEINITSPRLLQAPGDERNYYATMASWMVETCQKKPQLTGLGAAFL